MCPAPFYTEYLRKTHTFLAQPTLLERLLKAIQMCFKYSDTLNFKYSDTLNFLGQVAPLVFEAATLAAS
jgi:hypothetical protein